MFRYLAVSVVLAAATLTHAQPEFEIAYAFNGGDEVVRVEGEPFSIEVDADTQPSVIQNLSLKFPFAQASRLGLVNVEGEFDIALDEAQSFESMGRVAVAFNDLTFRSTEPDPVTVDLVLDMGEGFIVGSILPIGTMSETRVSIELAGQTRDGVIRLIWEGLGLPRREYTGIFGSGAFGQPWSADGFLVPVNEALSLRFELTRTVVMPDATSERMRWFSRTGKSPGFRTIESRPPGGVFRLPDGVTIDSEQAGIRDNEFIICRADLDGDGSLTIFDFLEFQNLFDRGFLLADFDLDGDLTIFDFLAFQNQFDAGCP